jgi:hypothetical protein
VHVGGRHDHLGHDLRGPDPGDEDQLPAAGHSRPAQGRRLGGQWGKTVCFLEGELYDPEGRLLAKASATAIPTPFSKFKK